MNNNVFKILGIIIIGSSIFLGLSSFFKDVDTKYNWFVSVVISLAVCIPIVVKNKIKK